MPKKGKKGKKAAAEEAARLEAEKAAQEAEAKRKFEEELKSREAALLLREEQIAKREQDAQALETDFRSKLEGLDAEVTLRARSGIAAAEAREAATERRAKMREEEAAQREAVFREAETTMAVREVEVAAREAAMGENVIGDCQCRTSRFTSIRVLRAVILSPLGRVYLSMIVSEFGPLRGPRCRDRETRLISTRLAAVGQHIGRLQRWIHCR